MADLKKVIKAIEICYTLGHHCTECPLFLEDDCNDKLMRDVLSLLKEQEAKQVVDINEFVEGMRVGQCPSCNKSIVSVKIDDEVKFCKYCGQAVKWE